jgi:hypothetical protein
MPWAYVAYRQVAVERPQADFFENTASGLRADSKGRSQITAGLLQARADRHWEFLLRRHARRSDVGPASSLTLIRSTARQLDSRTAGQALADSTPTI